MIFMEMKVLDLPLKAKYYDMYEQGVKPEEYREIKPYWCKRLARCDHNLCWMRDGSGQCMFRDRLHSLNHHDYTHIRFRNGYTKRTMLYALDGIRIGRGNPEWGAPKDEDVFILGAKNRIE